MTTTDITPTMRSAAVLMRARFKYRRDSKIDKWVIIDPKTDKIIGDCEDFALTTLAATLGNKKAAKRALWNGDAKIIYTRFNNRGHAVLWFNGHYIDNVQPYWSDTWPYGTKITYPRLVIATKLLLAKVL
jgi:hypothetical protein